LKASGGNLNAAIREADPDARAVLEIVGVADATGDAMKEGINLLRAAVRRELTRRMTDTSPEVIQRDRRIKQLSEQLTDRNVADSVAAELLAWLFDVSLMSEA
jgi:di/tripeptidase